MEALALARVEEELVASALFHLLLNVYAEKVAGTQACRELPLLIVIKDVLCALLRPHAKEELLILRSVFTIDIAIRVLVFRVTVLLNIPDLIFSNQALCGACTVRCGLLPRLLVNIFSFAFEGLVEIIQITREAECLLKLLLCLFKLFALVEEFAESFALLNALDTS